jgi:hypothetical protein
MYGVFGRMTTRRCDFEFDARFAISVVARGAR